MKMKEARSRLVEKKPPMAATSSAVRHYCGRTVGRKYRNFTPGKNTREKIYGGKIHAGKKPTDDDDDEKVLWRVESDSSRRFRGEPMTRDNRKPWLCRSTSVHDTSCIEQVEKIHVRIKNRGFADLPASTCIVRS